MTTLTSRYDNSERAVVLVSGGLDSCVALAWALHGELGVKHVIPVNFAYGQRHSREMTAAQQICSYYGLADPTTVNLVQALYTIGGSSLTSGETRGNPSTEKVLRTPSDLPPTFVPGRNIIMLSVAAGLAYVQEAQHIVGGWNVLDYSGYPDCRPEFFAPMQTALRAGLDYPVKIHTPLVQLSKVEIINLGVELRAPLEFTWSCYSGGVLPCGECDSCKIRAEGFAKVGIADPALV